MRKKQYILAVIIILIPVVVGLMVLSKTINDLKQQVVTSLTQVSDSKEEVFEMYIKETLDIGEFLQKSDIFKTYLDSLGGDQENLYLKEVTDLLHSIQETKWGKYHHIFLFDDEYKIMLSPDHGAKVKGSPSSHFNENVITNEWARDALKKGNYTVSDYAHWTESNHSHQMLFYPLKNTAGKTKVVMGVELSIPYELDFLNNNINFGETAKVSLVSEAGTSINVGLPKDQYPINTLGIKTTKEKGYYSGETLNERGVEVIGVYSKLKNYPSILAVEIDKDEAYKDIRGIIIYFIVGITSVAIILSLLIVLLLMGGTSIQSTTTTLPRVSSSQTQPPEKSV